LINKAGQDKETQSAADHKRAKNTKNLSGGPDIQTIYKKIRLQKITEEIADQIRLLIKDGKLLPGEKLPPERTFSEMLGVGRSSLREAINILETQGFIETRKRQGVYVSNLGSPIITDPFRQILEEDQNKLLHLYEVRKDIELAAAYMAAKFRSKEDLSRMQKLLEKMEKDSRKSALDLQDDLGFHMVIAQSSNNIFRSHLLKSIFELSNEYLNFLVGIMTEKASRILKLYEDHVNIYTAIEKQDQALAKARMEDHLVQVEDIWKQYMKEKPE